MKRKILFALVALIFLSCQEEEAKCLSLKEGNFSFQAYDGKNVSMQRGDGISIENYNFGERISQYKIEWIEDCSYILYDRQLLQGSDPDPEFSASLPDTLLVEITEFSEQSYTCVSRFLHNNTYPSVESEIGIDSLFVTNPE